MKSHFLCRLEDDYKFHIEKYNLDKKYLGPWQAPFDADQYRKEAIKPLNKFEESKMSKEEIEVHNIESKKAVKKELKELSRKMSKKSNLTSIAKRNIRGDPPRLSFGSVKGMKSIERIPGISSKHTQSISFAFASPLH